MQLVITQKGGKPARDTYNLEKSKVKISQDTKRKQVSEGHSQPGEGRVQG